MSVQRKAGPVASTTKKPSRAAAAKKPSPVAKKAAARKKKGSKARASGPAQKSPFATVERAIEEFQRGRCVIITDDEDRENEGDLCLPAQFTTPDDINFMAKYGRGLICTALSSERVDRLSLAMMVNRNTAPLGTAFTVSVEARSGVSTGISAGDRARTVQVLIDPESTSADLVSPGHMFPLRARDGGVLVRAGQTEASVDLCRLSGLLPGAVICEIMKADGTMARLPELTRFGKRHGIPMISVEQIIRYRLRTEQLVERITEANLPTRFGTFRIIGYKVPGQDEEHVALVMGDVASAEPALVRVHSQCVTGDVFSSLRCDCGAQMDIALEQIGREGRGAFVYMQQERAWHRPAQQAARVCVAGQGAGHGGGQSGPGLRRRPARLRGGDADPARPWDQPDSTADQQSGQAPWALRLWSGGGGARPGDRAGELAQRGISEHETGKNGALAHGRQRRFASQAGGRRGRRSAPQGGRPRAGARTPEMAGPAPAPPSPGPNATPPGCGSPSSSRASIRTSPRCCLRVQSAR